MDDPAVESPPNPSERQLLQQVVLVQFVLPLALCGVAATIFGTVPLRTTVALLAALVLGLAAALRLGLPVALLAGTD